MRIKTRRYPTEREGGKERERDLPPPPSTTTTTKAHTPSPPSKKKKKKKKSNNKITTTADFFFSIYISGSRLYHYYCFSSAFCRPITSLTPQNRSNDYTVVIPPSSVTRRRLLSLLPVGYPVLHLVALPCCTPDGFTLLYTWWLYLVVHLVALPCCTSDGFTL